jgi:hypothetical protein
LFLSSDRYFSGYIQRHQRGPYVHLNPVPNQTKTG